MAKSRNSRVYVPAHNLFRECSVGLFRECSVGVRNVVTRRFTERSKQPAEVAILHLREYLRNHLLHLRVRGASRRLPNDPRMTERFVTHSEYECDAPPPGYLR